MENTSLEKKKKLKTLGGLKDVLHYVSHTFPYLPLSNYHVTLKAPHNLQTSLNNSLDSDALFWICSSIFSEEPLSI